MLNHLNAASHYKNPVEESQVARSRFSFMPKNIKRHDRENKKNLILIFFIKEVAAKISETEVSSLITSLQSNANDWL